MKNPRGIIAMAAGALIAAALASPAFWFASENKRMAGLQSAHERLMALKEEMAPIEQRLGLLEAKRRNSRGDAVEAVDSVLESVGLKDKLKSLKLVPSTDMAEAEERAELSMEKISLNETVNLLYALESSPSPILTRKATLKISFEKPTLLNLTLSLSHIRAQ